MTHPVVLGIAGWVFFLGGEDNSRCSFDYCDVNRPDITNC